MFSIILECEFCKGRIIDIAGIDKENSILDVLSLGYAAKEHDCYKKEVEHDRI